MLRPNGNIRLRRVYPWSFRMRRQIREMELGPDGREEHRFRPLDEVDPALADTLRHTFVPKWLTESGFPPSRYDEAMATVDIRVAPDEEPGEQRLRVTSTFTGSTRWLYEWDGDEQEAIAFVEDVAGDEAGWVHDERRLNGPTEWD